MFCCNHEIGSCSDDGGCGCAEQPWTDKLACAFVWLLYCQCTILLKTKPSFVHNAQGSNTIQTLIVSSPLLEDGIECLLKSMDVRTKGKSTFVSEIKFHAIWKSKKQPHPVGCSVSSQLAAFNDVKKFVRAIASFHTWIKNIQVHASYLSDGLRSRSTWAAP